MKIREHVFTLGRCVFCGARQETTEVDEFGNRLPDTRTCVERDIGAHVLRPEPARRTLAHEDFKAIRAAMIAIREAAKPRCEATQKTVHDCLRTSAKCPEACPHSAYWVGPEFMPEEAGAFC